MVESVTFYGRALNVRYVRLTEYKRLERLSKRMQTTIRRAHRQHFKGTDIKCICEWCYVEPASDGEKS